MKKEALKPELIVEKTKKVKKETLKSEPAIEKKQQPIKIQTKQQPSNISKQAYKSEQPSDSMSKKIKMKMLQLKKERLEKKARAKIDLERNGK